MKLIVDASVIIKWYVAEIDSAPARELLIDERYDFCVPAHAFGEIGNAIATYVRRGLLPRTQVAPIGHSLPERLTSYPIEKLTGPAIDIALDIGSTVYDAFYIALAIDFDTCVATADERLVVATARTAWHHRVTHFTNLVRS